MANAVASRGRGCRRSPPPSRQGWLPHRVRAAQVCPPAGLVGGAARPRTRPARAAICARACARAENLTTENAVPINW